MNRESIPLIYKEINSGLSVFFATLCIIDIFGIFPIIALPRAIVQCGLYGIPLVLAIVGLQIYTSALLGKSWIIATALDPHISRKNRNPLAAVTELTLGPRARDFVTILLDITVFGCGIPNLLVASQNLQLFGLKVSNNEFNLSFCYWLLVVGILLCPLMWLGSPRDMKWVASLSTLAVGLTAILVWWCIITDDRTLNVLQVPISPTWDKLISGYGMLAFQFDVHPTLMTIQVDMKKPENINKAVIISFLISGTLFGITASLAVWKYGGSTTTNILQVVPASSAIKIAILIAALQLCLSSVMGHSALFQHLEDRLRVERSFGWKRCAMRSAVVVLSVAIGESVPRFDIVMSLIGGTLTGPLVFVLPPLMYIRARALKEKSGCRHSTPEIFSNSQKHSGDETFSNLRIHSQSVYYGFSDSNADSNRYSYVYYDDVNDDDNSSADLEDDLHRECFSKNDLQLKQQNKDVQLVLVEASRIIQRRRKTISGETFVNSRIYDWLGYSVVFFGIVITLSSTYINIKNTIRFVSFTPPCIFNVSTGLTAFNITQS